MTDSQCRLAGEQGERLVAYLYDDMDLHERDVFEAHLSTCALCRDELAAFGAVRVQLGAWVPPEPVGEVLRRAPVPAAAPSFWRAIPTWAQAVAAVLVIGVSAGIANLDVRYDSRGLSIRTGWSQRATSQETVRRVGASAVSAAMPATAAAAGAAPPWRADLEGLERRLRAEGVGAPASRGAVPAEADLFRRVRSLIEESERRQQRELALRVAAVVGEVDAQRRADLVKIDRSLGILQNNTGVEVMKQRELLNYLVRASQRE